MERWNPNLYLKEGQEKSFNPEYLDALVIKGRKIQSNHVPVIYSLAHLANLSKTLYVDLHAFASRANFPTSDFPYKNFSIKKRSGGRRWISIPVPPLMAVQSWINRNILGEIAPHDSATAFVPGLTIPLKTHAERHCGSNWVLKLDLKNFFSNISEKQVYEIFRSLNYPKLLSFEMARICTRITPKRIGQRWINEWEDIEGPYPYIRYIGSLPQGAPTSPALSNLVCVNMDEELSKLTAVNNGVYSRYADDMCFSFMNSSRNDILNFKKSVNQILWKYSFNENKSKTRIIPPGSRKIITGLVIDSGKATIPRELRSRIREHIYYSGKYGIPQHCENKGFRSVIGFRNHLHGLIMYVASINSEQGEKFKEEFNKLSWLEFDV